LAITAASKRLYQEFEANWTDQKHLFHGHTFAGHPVGCTAVIENIKMYRENKLLSKIRKNSNFLAKRIRDFNQFPIVKDLRGKGLLAAFDLVNNGTPIKSINGIPISMYIVKESLKRGVYLRSLGSTIIIIPPLAIGKELLEKIMDTQFEIVADIQRNLV
jgi:adenosylmethionine-8-amino-7-oxononanoate aminotransferase